MTPPVQQMPESSYRPAPPPPPMTRLSLYCKYNLEKINNIHELIIRVLRGPRGEFFMAALSHVSPSISVADPDLKNLHNFAGPYHTFVPRIRIQILTYMYTCRVANF